MVEPSSQLEVQRGKTAVRYRVEEKFHEAVRALIGPASQRKRLEHAYLDNLSDLQAAEVPVSQQSKFAQLRATLTHERQLHPEIVIEAMSDDEVADAARQIFILYDEITGSGAL
ncbi:MAG TPA: hypothetical protein VF931_02385 [Steroidobacteraceae bacterium]